jgi:hypothetical protein
MLETAASTARRWISPFPRYTRGQPYGRWVLLSTCGEEDAMTAALTRPVQQRVGQFARLWWLPAGGYGNGLGDSSWVPALEISGQVVAPVPTTLAVLTVGAALRAIGIRGAPAHAATALAAAGVGTSRVCLGVHWPADVVAGWLFAIGWLHLTDPDSRAR